MLLIRKSFTIVLSAPKVRLTCAELAIKGEQHPICCSVIAIVLIITVPDVKSFAVLVGLCYAFKVFLFVLKGSF